ncbi:MAG TPA: hypothetical protein VFZ70_09550 [Euzebyales bacterium]
MRRSLVAVVALGTVVAACAGADDAEQLVVSAPTRAVADAGGDASFGSSTAPAGRPQPSLTRAIDWRITAGSLGTQAVRGGVGVSLERLSLILPERWCPDDAPADMPACAEMTRDIATVVAVDAIFDNTTGLRREIRPEDVVLDIGGRRWTAVALASTSGPAVVDDLTVAGRLVWLVDLTVDDIRDHGTVELLVPAPLPEGGGGGGANRGALRVVVVI